MFSSLVLVGVWFGLSFERPWEGGSTASSWGGAAGDAPPDAMLVFDASICSKRKIRILIKKSKVEFDFVLDSIEVVKK